MPPDSARRASLVIGIAVGIRRSVAALQPNLMGTQPVELQEEFLIQLHPASRIRVNLYHPALYAIRIKLLVPRRIQRVGVVNALPVPADLHHLRPAVQCLLRFFRMCCAPDDSARSY